MRKKISTLDIPLIEYVFESSIKNEEGKSIPQVILIKASEIEGITQLDDTFCILYTLNREYKVYGTMRTLSNRWTYCLEKTHIDYYDHIIRPTTAIYHDPSALVINDSYLDESQAKAFITAVAPQILNNKRLMNIIFGYNEYN